MLHAHCMHTARAGQEEHSSQGTAKGEWRGKIRPEISQKLGGQSIPATAAAGREPGEGKGFQDHRALWVKCVCFHMDESVCIRTNALCEMHF